MVLFFYAFWGYHRLGFDGALMGLSSLFEHYPIRCLDLSGSKLHFFGVRLGVPQPY